MENHGIHPPSFHHYFGEYVWFTFSKHRFCQSQMQATWSLIYIGDFLLNPQFMGRFRLDALTLFGSLFREAKR